MATMQGLGFKSLQVFASLLCDFMFVELECVGLRSKADNSDCDLVLPYIPLCPYIVVSRNRGTPI